MLLAVELFGFGILTGAGLTLVILHLRPIRGAAPLSLLGTDAVTAQIPPHPTMHMPFYPTADDEYHLRGVTKDSEFQESHPPIEARR